MTVRPLGCRGVVLPLVLGLLAVLAVLGASGFLMARLDRDAGRSVLLSARALEAAETGLVAALGRWDRTALDSLAAGTGLSLGSGSVPGGGAYSATVDRLGGGLYLVRVDATVSSGRAVAHRTLGRLVRMTVPDPSIRAALTVLAGGVFDSLRARGADSAPAWGASCGPPDTAVAGVVVPSGTVTASTCAAAPCLSGNPAVAVDSMLGQATLSRLGPVSFAGLAGRAGVTVGGSLGTVQPAVAGLPAACDTTALLNWGEPWRSASPGPCDSYYPVIYSPGNLTTAGGRGQGILLVAGDLELGGGMEFHGLVVVQGRLRAGAGGGTILGAVLAGGLVPGPAAGPLTMGYSACALGTVLRERATPAGLSGRGWLQMY